MLNESRQNWKILLRAKPFLFRQSAWLMATVILALLAGVTAFGLPYSMMTLTDLAVEGNVQGFNRFIFLGLGLVLTDFLVTLAWKSAALRLRTYLAFDLRERLIEHLQRMQMKKVETYQSGDLVARLGENVSALTTYLVAFAEFVFQPVKLLVALIFIGLLNWKILVFLVLVVPFATPLYNRLSLPLEKYYGRIRETQGRAGSLVEDALRGIYVIKAFNLQNPISEKYAGILNELKQGRLLAEKQQAYLMLTGALIRFLPLLLGYVLGGFLAFRGELTVGGLMAFINLNWVAISAYEALLVLIGQTRETIPVAMRVFDILDQPVEISVTTVKTLPFPSVNSGTPAITFEKVRFGYESGQPVFADLSFDIQAGETVALVGASGCGKSTIIKLICGFYAPEAGVIRINGQPVNPETLTTVRQELSLVAQDTYLFPISIQENLQLSQEGVTPEMLIAAAEAANANDFINRLPDGYQTCVMEGGRNFSGGQKQCLAIARSLLKDAPILLLDEPTASLDARSEHEVQEAIDRLTVGRTVLMVAHRLSTVRAAQRILVLENGRIVESGNHKELMALDGVYHRLYMAQADASMEKEAVA